MNTSNGEAQVADAELPACGIVMPISAWADHSSQHWEEVRDIIERAISSASMAPRPVWVSNETDIIQGRIVRNLHDCPMVVCDISGLNPNVMFELGMRLTFRKPVIVLADDNTRLPFDTGVIDTLIYPSDLHFKKIEKLIETLTSRILDLTAAAETDTYKPYLDTFGTFEIVEPPSEHVAFSAHIEAQLEQIQSKLNRIEGDIYRLDVNKSKRDRDARNALAGWVTRANQGSDDAIGFSVDNALKEALLRSPRFEQPDDLSISNWTDERIDRLVELWNEGKTATEIAEDLGGVSRNAVIGKAHRLGLKSRPMPPSGSD